ncbi:MAG: SDR family NAD(P)-dependent oxidoreductase, partial [Pseudomonadota bacterium]
MSDGNARTDWAVVTGASEGIGRAVADALADAGYAVVAIARNLKRLHSLAEGIESQGGRCLTIACDLSDPDAVSAACAQILDGCGVPAVLVNIAGVGGFGELDDYDHDQMDAPFQVPVRATMQLCHALSRPMSNAGGGSIVTVVTPAAYFPLPFMAPYTASRWALLGFTEALGEELHGTGVHVGVVCPGEVRTDYLHRNGSDIGWFPRISRAFPALEPDDVATRILTVIRRKRREAIFPAVLWWFVKTYRLAPRTTIAL